MCNRLIEGFFDIIFFPTRYLYKLYEPSNFRKSRSVKKYYKKIINKAYKDLLYYGELIFTDCRVSEDDNSDIISTQSYNSYYPFSSYKHYTNKTSGEVLDEILLVFKKDNQVIVKEIKAEDIFKWGYGRYKDEKFYKVMVKDGK